MFLSKRLATKGKAKLGPAIERSGPDWLFNEDRSQFAGLALAVNTALKTHDRRLVQFVAAGPGEGTSSVSWAYARASAEMFGHKVLHLSACIAPNASTSPASPSDAADGRPMSQQLIDEIEDFGTGVFHGILALNERNGERSSITEKGFVQRVPDGFDEVVIDCPAASVSQMGRAVASFADAVVIVVEAEKTRAPVAQKLLEDLSSMGANVLGTVLNKRRFYVPRWIYSRL
jgi:Mrp family chromosome partitioning ATPase